MTNFNNSHHKKIKKKRSTIFFVLILSIISPVYLVNALENNDVKMVEYPEHVSATELALRRDKVRQIMGKGLMVPFSAEPKVFSNDVNYPFRQESNIFYLTGINQPGTILILLPENQGQKEILFLPKRKPSLEIWTGKMLGPQEARRMTGIEHIWPAKEYKGFIDTILNGSIYRKRPPSNKADYHFIIERIKGGNITDVWLLADIRQEFGLRYPNAFRLASELSRFPAMQPRLATSIFRNLRLIKSKWELANLKRAIDITCLAQRNIMILSGQIDNPINESTLDGSILSTYRRHGAHWGFPSIVASGPNTTTLHYEDNSRDIGTGELILADIGAAVGNYTADVTRTFPRNGIFSKEQREVYEIVLQAQTQAIAAVRPETTLRQVHNVARKIIVEGLLELGLITNRTEDQYRMWFMHSTSHMLGLDVHDVGGSNIPLKPGMVLTVEPGIYIRENTLENLKNTPMNRILTKKIRPAFERYLNIGIRIEDDILVTENGNQILSECVPKTIDAIEALMANHLK